MPETIGRVEVKSLKTACVEELERQIVSGRMPIGSAVPAERDLASRLGVSRPIVHEAMVELASKGFVRVEPRKGAFVNDFYRRGTLAIIETIVLHTGGELSPEALADVLAFRLLMEIEAARLAASRRGKGFLDALVELVELELARRDAELDDVCELDFEFHLLVAEASGSLVYPLLVNSFRPLYLNLSRRFYSALERERASVTAYHERVADAIAEGDEGEAVAAMRDMLEQGERVLGSKPRG